MEGILKLGETEVMYNRKYYIIFDKVQYSRDDYYILVNPQSGNISKCLCGDISNVKIK